MKTRKVVIVSIASALVLFLVLLVVTGKTWRAISYAVLALFVFLVLQALYFWGALLLEGMTGAVARRRSLVPWSVGSEDTWETPEHDLDPGLDLLAAGVLVYRLGEVKPHAYFREVSLANARAVRPFVVARTGAARDYRFQFTLSDENERIRFNQEITFPLDDAPQMIMPSIRLQVNTPRGLNNQRWSLQVRSGVTVVTSFRFVFVNGAPQSDWQPDMLPQLLDEAIKRDALSGTQEIVLEDL